MVNFLRLKAYYTYCRSGLTAYVLLLKFFCVRLKALCPRC